MSSRNKESVISFKVDKELSEILESIPNKSAFIRKAVLTALENRCPLCSGTGVLTPEQQRHWEHFSHQHHVEKCEDCKAFHLVCEV